MEIKAIPNGLQSISGGLQMLSDNKIESLSALAEISIILSNPKIVEYHQVSEDINPFLASLHFLLRDLSKESVVEVTKFIDARIVTVREPYSPTTIQRFDDTDYKGKYHEALEKLILLQEEMQEIKKKKRA